MDYTACNMPMRCMAATLDRFISRWWQVCDQAGQHITAEL